LRNLDEKIQKSTHFSVEIETNCRNAENFRSRRISRSRSRLFGLDIVVETKSRSLNLDRDISIDETNFLTLSRFSRLSRLTVWRRRDQESRSRPRRDKSRPPSLNKRQDHLITHNFWWGKAELGKRWMVQYGKEIVATL
jgi:hypothetical protein